MPTPLSRRPLFCRPLPRPASGRAAWTAFLVAAALTWGSGASAAGWSAARCGREPQAPSVDGSSVAHYNASIDRVAAYEKAARAYSACVNQQASADQTAISNDARARMSAINAAASTVQRRIAGNFNALSAELHSAGQKLGAKP